MGMMGNMNSMSPMMNNKNNMGMMGNMNNMNPMMNNKNNMGMMGNMNNMGMMGNMNNMNNMNPMMMNNMNNMGMMGNMNNMGMMGNMNNMNPMMMNNMNNMNWMNMNNMGGMGMNPLMMGGAGMNMGMNPMMGGMGNNMNMMGMGMNPMMGGMGMNMKQNMTPEQLKQWKQQQRYQGYLMGKLMAEQKKKNAQGSNPTASSSTTNTAPANETSGEISITFKKGGNTKTIKMNSSAMIAELLMDYYEKTNNQGTFKFKGAVLDPNDCTTLADKGMKNGDEIIVS